MGYGPSVVRLRNKTAMSEDIICLLSAGFVTIKEHNAHYSWYNWYSVLSYHGPVKICFSAVRVETQKPLRVKVLDFASINYMSTLTPFALSQPLYRFCNIFCNNISNTLYLPIIITEKRY